MKRNVRFCVLYYVFISLLVLSLLSISEPTEVTKVKAVCRTKECMNAALNLENSINWKINPCDDFYEFACGHWPRFHKNTIYPFPISSTLLRAMQNDQEILEFLNQRNDPDEPKSVHKARLLYNICLNGKAYNGTQLLKKILSDIDLPIVPFSTNEYRDFDDVTALAKATKTAGVNLFFDISVDVDPRNQRVNAISLSKPELAFDSDLMPILENPKKNEYAPNTEFIEKIVKKMCEVASSMCCMKNDIVQEISEVIDHLIFTDLLIIKSRSKFNSSFIPTIYTLEELQKISDDVATKADPCRPKLNWTRYIEEMFDGLENVKLDLRIPSEVEIVVHEMSFIRDMIEFIHKTEPEIIELMLWWKVVTTLLPYADFEIFKYLNDNSGNRRDRCNEIVINSFGMAVSYMYLKKDEYNKAKIEVEKMLELIKKSYEILFKLASWMDKKTKEKSLAKLNSIKSLIGYPSLTEFSSILDDKYGNVDITGYFLDTMVKKIQTQIKRNLNKLDQINDSTSKTWSLAPDPTYVNAFYDFSKNMITIPAGLLGPPLYQKSLKALIYGSIGMLVGHELFHGFDYIGRQYNSDGKEENWWSEETLAKYENKSRCFLEAYANYDTSFQGIYQKGNSEITFLQDIADNVGFKAAFGAYIQYINENGDEYSLPDFENYSSEQLFTLGFANFWCESPTNLSANVTQFDDHSPAAVRVNGVLKNSYEFSAVWKCSEGTKMNPSNKKCYLW